MPLPEGANLGPLTRLTKRRPLLLAISGGVDSVVLLKLLLDVGIRPVLAHVNYGLRGEDSDADHALVLQLAKAHKLKIHHWCIKASTWDKLPNQSIEMAARTMRYRWFGHLAHHHGYQGVLIAHHLDDNLETVLLNLVRGTGLAGLKGMQATMRHGKLLVIRPLITVTKADIIVFAVAKQLVWREDLSNQSGIYKRNLLRHEVLPILQAAFPNWSKTLPRSLTRITAETKLLRQMQRQFQQAVIQTRLYPYQGEIVLTYPATMALTEYLNQLAMLSPMLAKYGMTVGNQQALITALTDDLRYAIRSGYQYQNGLVITDTKVVNDTAVKPEAKSSKGVWMTASHVLVLDRHRIYVLTKSAYHANLSMVFKWDVGQPITLPTGGVIAQGDDAIAQGDHAIAQGDHAIAHVPVPKALTVRTLRAGDKIWTSRTNRSRVVDVLSRLGWPDHHKRACWLLIYAAEEVVWIVNGRVSAAFWSDDNTNENDLIRLSWRP